MNEKYVCPVCHNDEHPPGAKFCIICGHPLPATEQKTNLATVRGMSLDELAEYGVFGCVPAGCTTPAWYGHFGRFADTREEAIRREKEWLLQLRENGASHGR